MAPQVLRDGEGFPAHPTSVVIPRLRKSLRVPQTLTDIVKELRPEGAWEWTKTALILIALATIFTCLYAAAVDGDSMWPLKTGDRIIFNRFAHPYAGATVFLTIPGKEPMVKLVMEDRAGHGYGGKIVHDDEIAVEGTNPNSVKIGIIKRKYVRGVAIATIYFPKMISSAEKADGRRPKELGPKPELSQVPHFEIINGKKVVVVRTDHNQSNTVALSIAGDWTKEYRSGRYVFDAGTGGCYKISHSSLTNSPNILTVVEIDGNFGSAVLGQVMYLLDDPIPPGPSMDAGTLKPTGPVGPAAR